MRHFALLILIFFTCSTPSFAQERLEGHGMSSDFDPIPAWKIVPKRIAYLFPEGESFPNNQNTEIIWRYAEGAITHGEAKTTALVLNVSNELTGGDSLKLIGCSARFVMVEHRKGRFDSEVLTFEKGSPSFISAINPFTNMGPRMIDVELVSTDREKDLFPNLSESFACHATFTTGSDW